MCIYTVLVPLSPLVSNLLSYTNYKKHVIYGLHVFAAI